MEWWQQCEDMVAFENAYQLTGDLLLCHPSILIKSGIHIPELMIDKALDEEMGFQIKSLPILEIRGRLLIM